MKVKINIELWDNTPASKLQEIGLTTKFLEICYQEAFKQLVGKICGDAPGMNYTLSVEAVDNTEK